MLTVFLANLLKFWGPSKSFCLVRYTTVVHLAKKNPIEKYNVLEYLAFRVKKTIPLHIQQSLLTLKRVKLVYLDFLIYERHKKQDK